MSEDDPLKAAATEAAKLAADARASWTSVRVLSQKAKKCIARGDFVEGEKLARRLVKKTASAAGMDNFKLADSFDVMMGELGRDLILNLDKIALNVVALTYCIWGDSLQGLGRTQEAINAFQIATDIKGNNPLSCPRCYFTKPLQYSKTGKGSRLECEELWCGFKLDLGKDFRYGFSVE